MWAKQDNHMDAATIPIIYCIKAGMSLVVILIYALHLVRYAVHMCAGLHGWSPWICRQTSEADT